MQEALAHGAAVLMEEQCDLEGVYICEDLSKAQIILGKALYPDLCEGMLCIGVTGTSGKSSTSAFLYQMLSAAMPCVRIGTHQVSGAGWEEEIANTTPPLCELIRLIEMARARQVRCVIMEVSSHAIAGKAHCAAAFRSSHLYQYPGGSPGFSSLRGALPLYEIRASALSEAGRTSHRES